MKFFLEFMKFVGGFALILALSFLVLRFTATV
jgi:hypothetical protein